MWLISIVWKMQYTALPINGPAKTGATGPLPPALHFYTARLVKHYTTYSKVLSNWYNALPTWQCRNIVM